MVDNAPDLKFSPEEQEIVDHIGAAMRGIQALGLRKDARNLGVELASAVHGMQMFVLMHAMQRVGFEGTSKWYDKA